MQAGRYRKTIKYSRPTPSDTGPTRKAKKASTAAAQRFINIKNSIEKLQLLLCANFDQPGISQFCTFTFTTENLPANRKHAKKIFSTYLAEQRFQWKQQGKPFPYIYTIEGTDSPAAASPGESLWETAPWKDETKWAAVEDPPDDEEDDPTTRLHIHCFLNIQKDEIQAIKESWPYGQVYVSTMIVDELSTFGRLASYCTKDARKENLPPGTRSYIPAKNLLKPTIDGHWCRETDLIEVPAEAETIKTGADRDEVYGSYSEYIYYRMPR